MHPHSFTCKTFTPLFPPSLPYLIPISSLTPLFDPYFLPHPRRRKLGLRTWDPDTCPALYRSLQRLLPGTDWTLFWRQLSLIRVVDLKADDTGLLQPLTRAFDKELDQGEREKWAGWVREWLGLVKEIGIQDDEERQVCTCVCVCE